MSDESDRGREPITAEGIEALRAEVERLESEDRPEMAERIKAARELGDLKENAEYHIAKDDQAKLEMRIKRLRQRLSAAVVLDADAGAEAFAFGRTAEVADDAGKVHTWTLVGSTEANLAEGRLSVESPIGKAMRDCAVGESVTVETPRGPRTFEVRALVG